VDACVTPVVMEQEAPTSNLSAVDDAQGDGSIDGIEYREAPHNTEAEQALLGAILVKNEAAHRVSEFLEAEHFYEPVHGRIYDAAMQIIERGQHATPITLKSYFERDEALADVGSDAYLARLAGAAVTIINAEDYGRVIYDCFLRRELITVGEDVVNTAYEPAVDETAIGQIEVAETALFRLAESGSHEGGFQTFSNSVINAIDRIEGAYKSDSRLVGVSTGLTDLDKMLGGLQRSDLVILAGRPSMGKTALATNIAFSAARAFRQETDESGTKKTVDGAVVGFFSLEMAADQLASRILAEVAQISSEKLQRGELTNDQFIKVANASKEIQSLPFFIDDTPALSVAALRTRARRLKRQHGLGLIVVDYLQLLRPAGKSSLEHRVQEVSQITQALKALAKELDVPVLALSQLSRAVEQREDKRPLLSDLRESGSIEQDADVVMFIYRDEYYRERREPEEKGTEEYFNWQKKMEEVHNVAEVIIGKQRHGPTGKVDLFFKPEFTKFGNMERSDHIPDQAPY
jgi:replicative DNA helicase